MDINKGRSPGSTEVSTRKTSSRARSSSLYKSFKNLSPSTHQQELLVQAQVVINSNSSTGDNKHIVNNMSPNIFKDDDASGSATADSRNEGNVASMMHKAGKKLPTFFKRKIRRGSIGNKVGPGSDGDKAAHHHSTKGRASPLEVDVLLSIPSTNSTISALDDDDASHAATLPIRMDKFGFILQDQDGEYYADGSEIGTANNDDAQASNLNQEDGAQCLKGNTPKRSRLVKNFARKGLPNSMRHKAWTIVTGVDAIMAEKEGEYLELVVRSSEMEEGKTSWSVIERDINRTFPKHYLFQDSALGEDELDGGLEEDVRFAEGGQAALRRLLRAYSAYDSEVGYCQGMNFIAAMFLTFLEEEESFWIFYGELKQNCISIIVTDFD